MGPAIGGSLVMAIGIAITPLAITVTLIVLTTPQARVNGPAFIVGWFLALAVVGGLALIVMGSTSASHSGMPADWVSWLKIALGIVLLLLAIYEVGRRPGTDRLTARPSWTQRLDEVGPPGALALGALLAGARPKNILLVIAGAAVIAGTGISFKQQSIAYVVFAAIATIGVAIPVVTYFVMGDKAPGTLRALQEWIGRNSAPIVSVLCLVIGANLIGAGISALTA